MGERKIRAALHVVGELRSLVSVDILSTTQTIPAGGGMVSMGGASVTYTLPTSTAGTLYHLFFSSGATNVVVPAAPSDTRFWGLPSTDVIGLATNIVGSTGDHCIVIAQSSSQWNILSYSSSLTSSS